MLIIIFYKISSYNTSTLLLFIRQTLVHFLSLQFQFLVNEQMNNFEIICKVGEGAFASVYKVKRKQDGLIYAMKKIKIANGNSRQISNCLNEVRILASITNPYIIGYKDAMYDQPSGSILLITEFAPGGDLTSFIKTHQKQKQSIGEVVIWRMAIQMLHGLKILHRMNIFHRDIKAANILLTKDHEEAKLADLNVSKISKSGLAVTQTGTPYYASPEVWSDLPYNGKCDIWSLGCVLYQMAAFHPPFMAADINSLKKKIIKGVYDRIPSSYSEELQSFIRMCLTTNTKERPSTEALLHHTFIRKRIYMFTNDKFNEIAYDSIINKENKLLQTIRVPNRYNFGNDLKSRLPKSNYENVSQVLMKSTDKQRVNRLKSCGSDEKLPELMLKRNSSREAIKQKVNIPKPRLLYLR